MDPIYTTRIAMAGWVFVAVLITSFWESNNPSVQAMFQSLFQGQASIGAVLLAALIGIGAPPAVGFLMEKVASLLFTLLRRDVTVYPASKELKRSLSDALNGNHSAISRESASGLFHVFFYTFAGSHFLEWARRRRTQMYASLTSALSILVALLVDIFAFGIYPVATITVSVALMVVLIANTIREGIVHERSVAAWFALFGDKLIRDYAEQLTQVATTADAVPTTTDHQTGEVSLTSSYAKGN